LAGADPVDALLPAASGFATERAFRESKLMSNACAISKFAV
jgi:hypothetical protein